MTSTACSSIALSTVFVAGLEPDEKGGAALNIETERDLFLWRPDRGDAEHDEQERQRGGKEAFPQPLIGGEIPAEKNEHRRAR